MEIGEKIKLLRNIRDITQQDLADKLYVSRQAIQKWESGASSPDVSKLVDLASIFLVSVDALVDNKIEKEDLLKIALHQEIKKNKNESKFHPTSALDYLIYIPFILGVGIIFFIIYMLGAMLLLLLFSLAGFGPLYSIYSLINLFFNISSGTGVVLLSIAYIFLGIGIAYPCYLLGRMWLDKYKKIVKLLNSKIINSNLFKRSGSNEN